MRIFKRIVAAVLVLSMLLVSVNAEELLDLYFDASLDLKTGETTLTPKELDTETDSSDLWVEVTKITPDGTASSYYSGLFGDYDNGRWVNMDLSNNKPLLLYDWQTQNSYWVIPAGNPDLSTVNSSNSEGYNLSVSSNLMISSQIKLNGVNVDGTGVRIIDGANMECLINVINSSNEDGGLTAILTTYDEEGRLYNGSTYTIAASARETTNNSITYQFDAENEYTGKLMFWDSMNTLVPLQASIDFSQTSGANAYYYDADNRLLQVDKINGTSILFTYDRMGNLLTRTTRR